MLISSLFVRKQKTPPPRFAPGLFLILLVGFVLLGQARPTLGLVGLGTTLIVAAVLVEINRNRIWDMYKQTYKRRAGAVGLWSKPDPVYFNLNVYVLWPFILFIGLVCIWAAYLSS